MDGKYIKVRGCTKKIPFIYGIDFLTHDIPAGILAPSENTMAFMKFFSLLKACRYNLQVVICDDTAALEPALRQYYSTAKIQLCHVHFLENLRNYLKVRIEDKYQKFFFELQTAFGSKVHPLKRDFILRKLNAIYGRRDEKIRYILVDIWRMRNKLFAFNDRIKKCPCTNNIIEAYNSHLNGRLKTIKGFKSFQSAQRFLNAWMIRRRIKSFTDCGEPFKHLNGKCSLEKTLKRNAKLPKFDSL